MQLKDKWLTGLVKSFSLVDSTLLQQGFRRCGKNYSATYQLTIQDSATSSAYYLKIPTSLEKKSDPGSISIRIGAPILRKKVFMNKLNPSIEIPEAVWKAAESKLAEIADYIHSCK